MTAPTMTHATYAPPPFTVRGTADLTAIAELSEDAQALLAESPSEPTQRAFVDALVGKELFTDAIAFLAHALPHREAVWWAWVCARKGSGPTPKPVVQAALDATERWIVQPTEENRRAAMHFAELATFGTAAGLAAVSAFFTGGSIAPPEAPMVPPGEFITAKMVTACVTLAGVIVEPEKSPDKYKEYIRLALEVADRTKLWPA